MIRKLFTKTLITILALTSFTLCVKAESLFTLGASQTYSSAPKSLYGGVQARQVGDLLSIIMNESVSITNNLSYNSNKASNTIDNFSGFLNTVLGKHIINDHINNFGGSNEVTNSAATNNKIVFLDTIAVQVVQQMPNGNLVVQGKKTLVNANERSDLVVTGVVDPRWILATGQVHSRYVANLQFAMSGKGSVSRSNNEGIINKWIKYLF